MLYSRISRMLNRRVRGNLRFRMVAVVFAAMLMAGVLSAFFTAYIVSRRMGDILREGQEHVAQVAMSLSSDGNYSDTEIATMASFGLYSVRRVEPDDRRVLTNKEGLDAGEIVFSKVFSLPFVDTLFKAGDEYYVVSIFPNSALLFGLVAAILFSIATLITTGTLITSLMSKRFLRPIRELRDATAKVSMGDFSVRVRSPANRELSALTENFNHMVDDLYVTMGLQKDFIDNVSHEFKTPLSSIQGFAELLEDETLSPAERHEYLEIIRSESGRMSSLASNILKLSKLERQDSPGDIKEFSLSEQLRRVILMLEPQWSKKGIEFDMQLDEVTVRANEELLSQVWINLIDNAIKYTGDAGWIEVSLTGGSGKGVTVQIRDTGIGMDEEALSLAFEKFYQGDRSRKTSGSGLGLPLVKRIIELSGGEIRISSAPDEGTNVTVALPG